MFVNKNHWVMKDVDDADLQLCVILAHSLRSDEYQYNIKQLNYFPCESDAYCSHSKLFLIYVHYIS